MSHNIVGDFSPKIVSLTDNVLFGDVWERTQLSKRDRSLITVAALIAGGNTGQFSGHRSPTRVRCQLGADMRVSRVLALQSPVLDLTVDLDGIHTTSIKRRETWNTNG